MDEYPNAYLNRRIVQSKLYIEGNFAEATDLAQIADEGFSRLTTFRRLY